VLYAHAGKRHGMIKRTVKQIRNNRGTAVLFEGGAERRRCSAPRRMWGVWGGPRGRQALAVPRMAFEDPPERLGALSAPWRFRSSGSPTDRLCETAVTPPRPGRHPRSPSVTLQMSLRGPEQGQSYRNFIRLSTRHPRPERRRRGR
jgi:hypothetical protein